MHIRPEQGEKPLKVQNYVQQKKNKNVNRLRGAEGRNWDSSWNRIDRRMEGNIHQARSSKEMQHVGKSY